MTLSPTCLDWTAANQRALMSEVAGVRAAFERHAGRTPETPLPACDRDFVSAPDHVCRTFSLSAFERKVLLACAAVELDGAFGPLCALAQGDPGRPYPTFGLALAVFADAHWNALAPTGPLRRWSLISLARETPLTNAALRIDEAILHELAGVPELDARLRSYLAPAPVPGELAASQREPVERIVRLLRDVDEGRALVQLCGCDVVASAAVAAGAFAGLGANGIVLDARALPHDPVELERLAQAWSRETLLHGTALYLDAHGLEETADRRAAVLFAQKAAGPVVVGADEPLPFERRAAYCVSVGKPSRSEQRELWGRAVAAMDPDSDAAAALAAQFDFSGDRIRAVAGMLHAERGPDVRARAWAAACATARVGLDAVAQRLDSRAATEALVLPAHQTEVLADIVACARNRTRVYDEWGMARGGPRGLGLSALFHGPSGTGKTLAAESLGAALALDVYRVDLSALVSKYIGETEKNLRRVFDAAEDGGAILLFDECDALFGKRAEVVHGHDRYANIEVSYLLTRMEAYRGIAILTTNMKNAIDAAFLRRIRFVVAFPFPDYEGRIAIWQGSFPSGVPTSGLDFARIARLNVAGGNIRNIALHAAFLAAEANLPVCMEHVLRAARAECLKIERTPSELEIGAWV